MHLRILATDGFPLAATLYGDAASARALVTVNPATAVPRRFYREFAEFLASRGHLALTFDWRAMGESTPRPDARTASARRQGSRTWLRHVRMRDWGEKDLAGVLAWAAKEHPALPIVGVGHSAGGQMLCLAERAERYRAFVGVAAQSGHWRHWPTPQRWRRAFDWHVLLPVLAYTLGRIPGGVGLGDGLPKGIALEWARWCRHRDYILCDEPEIRRARLARLAFPFLSYSFADDSYGPKAAADWWAAQFPRARVERRHLEPSQLRVASVGHFGFFRRAQGGALWEEAAEWLERGAGS